MTILAHDQSAFSKSFSTPKTGMSHLDPAFMVVGLVSLLALGFMVLAVASGTTANYDAIAPVFG